jgi:beta-galactosidase
MYSRILPFALAALLLPAPGAFSETVDLTEDVWRFRLGDYPEARQADFDDARWQRVSLPHTWNGLDAQDGKNRLNERTTSGYRRVAAWYRQAVAIPEAYAGQRTYLRCDGASLVKHVYVNGELVGEHSGAFTAFSFEITDYVTPGEVAQIAIRVDNSEHPTIPTAELGLESGRKTLDILPLRGDFNLYGGIYRGIELVLKPALNISPTDHASSGVYVSTPEISEDRARVRVETVLAKTATVDGAAQLRAELRDASGQLVAEAERRFSPEDGAREALDLVVDAPRLWQGVADPYLYTLDVFLKDVDAATVDRVSERVGIRRIEFDPQRGFVLNGEVLKLRGVNRHQDWQDFGWAIGPEQHERDFALIREMGATAVRLAHYPQDPYVLELCDRLGLIVLMEIPLVGWVSDDEAFVEHTKSQLREMIRQYYNHPSIPVWGLWNELMNRAPATMPSPVPLVRELQALAEAEDPTRPTVGSANDTSEAAPGLRAVTDLITWNLYPGWYGESEPADMADWLVEKRALDDRAVIGVSEYGAGASIHQHEDWSDLQKPEPRSPWHPEEYQGYFHEQAYRAIAADPQVWGSFVWNMFDFAADHRDEGDRPGINDKGLVTHDRAVRKDAFFFYKASWVDTPVLHITSRRYSPRPAGPATVKVYSNAAAVALTLNGQALGTGSREGVVHLWENVRLEPGEAVLEASAEFAGETRTDTIRWMVQPTGQPVRYATLKFDDMTPSDAVDGVTAIEQQVYDYLMERGIPHAWGVCRLYQSDNPAYYAWLKARDAEGIEIWHHGNRHDRVRGESWEFKNRDAASQRENLRYTQERILEKTGIVLKTFGAPYNQTDAVTAEALNAMDSIETMYFAKGSPAFAGLQLNDRVNLESKTGVVARLADFKASYAEKESAEIIVLQAHPVYWDADEAMPRFAAILDFLEAEGRVFITPRDYYALQARE